MAVKYKHKQGDVVGTCIFLYELPQRKNNAGNSYRIAVFKCPSCGGEFEANIFSIRSGRRKSCGCLHRKVLLKRIKKHGLHDHPLYTRWSHIKSRCFNPNNPEYRNYGARGILICDEWSNDFKAFYDYMMALSNAMGLGLTIDRIDNNGNYEPGNVRWVERYIQNTNKRISPNSKTGYVGINKVGDKFKAKLTVRGETKVIGSFETIQEAIKERNRYIDDNKLYEHKIQYIEGMNKY